MDEISSQCGTIFRFFFGTTSMSEGLSVLAYGYGFLGGFAGAQPVVTQ